MDETDLSPHESSPIGSALPSHALRQALRLALGHARWLPFALLLGGMFVWALSGALAYDLRLMLLAGGLGAAWLLAKRLWPLALLALLALSPLTWQLGVQLPGRAGAIEALEPGAFLRIRGTVRQQERLSLEGERFLRLLLGEARISNGDSQWELVELEVLLPHNRRRTRSLYRRDLRIGGSLRGAEFQRGRLVLHLEETRFHSASIPIVTWRAEGLRAALQDRASYYLSRATAAAYLPIILGVRERGSLEAQSVVESFRQVGISHLFAISGLHIGLLFGLLLFLSHGASRFLLRGQGWLHTQAAVRSAIVLAVWGYIALIAFPVPAVRAAIMASMLIWSQLWGTRTPRLYVLCMAGLILVLITPTIIYDISFQLSFLSFFFLLIGLNLGAAALNIRAGPDSSTPWPSSLPTPWLTLWQRLGRATVTNITVTLAITVGIWPVLAMNFGRLSLLVFLGNLLMIPILSLLVLPSGLAALLVSWGHLGSIPGGWLERAVFAWLEWVLGAWLWLVKLIEQSGRGLVFPVDLDWNARHVFLYYALLAALILLGGFWKKSRKQKK